MAHRMAEKTRLQFETDTLPRFIETQRWYAAKGALDRTRPHRRSRGVAGRQNELAARAARLVGTAQEPACYFMPLALAWEDRDEDRVRNLSTSAIAKVRQQANVGVMGDAFADEAFCRAIVVADVEAPRHRDRAGQAAVPSDRRLCDNWRAPISQSLPAARPQGSSSNTMVVMGERLILKGYRQIRVTAPAPNSKWDCTSRRSCSTAIVRRSRASSNIRATTARRNYSRMLQAYVAESRRRMDLRAGVPAAPSGSASHRARHRRAARQRPRGVSSS